MLSRYDEIVVSCFDLEQESVAAILEVFWDEKSRMFRRDVDRLDVTRIYVGRPPAGGAHRKRIVLFTPGCLREQCALVVNNADGWSSLGYIVTSRRNGSCYQFGFHREIDYPAYSFTLVTDGNMIRHVSARKEDKWIFFEEGARLPEEEPANYRKRRIRDRVTAEYICRLASRLGYDIAGGSFWSSHRDALYYYEEP